VLPRRALNTYNPCPDEQHVNHRHMSNLSGFSSTIRKANRELILDFTKDWE